MSHIFEAAWAARYLIGFIALFLFGTCLVVAICEGAAHDEFSRLNDDERGER